VLNQIIQTEETKNKNQIQRPFNLPDLCTFPIECKRFLDLQRNVQSPQHFDVLVICGS